MKRSASHISSDSQVTSGEIKPNITPSPPSSTTKSKASPKKTPTPKKKKSTEEGSISPKAKNGEWTAEKRTKLMAMVIDIGFKQLNLESVATEFDVARQQITNQFAPSRKGGLGDKAIQAVRGDK